MSVSSARSRVDSLKGDISRLKSRIADERQKMLKEQGEAQRIASSITNSTSSSTVNQKLRNARAKEEKANQHEEKIVDLEKQLGAKEKSLGAAEDALSRASKQEASKEEQKRKRERDEELRQLKRIEEARRASQSPPFQPVQPIFPVPRPSPFVDRDPEASVPSPDFDYEVCLSFAGEDRAYVEMVAAGLKDADVHVFYDADETPSLWGKDLTERLDYVYRKASRYCLMFISEAYARKQWTRHERRSAMARAVEEQEEYLLPARFDDTELEGLRPTVSYVDLREHAPATVVDFVLEKLGRTP